jgi:hypothetical protein
VRRRHPAEKAPTASDTVTAHLRLSGVASNEKNASWLIARRKVEAG